MRRTARTSGWCSAGFDPDHDERAPALFSRMCADTGIEAFPTGSRLFEGHGHACGEDGRHASYFLRSLMPRPSMFIGSSTEGLPVAYALQAELEHDADATTWSQGVFVVGEGGLESLEAQARKCDFAALVLTADDLVDKRGKSANSPRDNVILEVGLFIGVLGRRRVFLVSCRDDELDLPTDLLGITPAQFNRRADGNLRAAIGPAATAVRERIVALGPLHTHVRPELTLTFDPNDPACVEYGIGHGPPDYQLRLRATNTGEVDLERIRCRIRLSQYYDDFAVIRHDVRPYAHSRLGTTLRPGKSDYFNIAYWAMDTPIVFISFANGSLMSEQGDDPIAVKRSGDIQGKTQVDVTIEARREDNREWLPEIHGRYVVASTDDAITLLEAD